MKLIKKKIVLNLFLVTVFLLLFITSLNAFAAENAGSTEVLARIETSDAVTTVSVTENEPSNNTSVSYDNTKILTGYIIFDCVIIALLIVASSLLVIFLCCKEREIDTKCEITSITNKENNKMGGDNGESS